MANTALISRILSDKELEKAFRKFLDRQGIARCFELANIHNDEFTAMRIYIEKPSSNEVKFARDIYNKAIVAHNDIYNKPAETLMGKIVEREGAERAFTPREMESLKAIVFKSPQWKKTFQWVKVMLNQKLDAFAQKEFPHTPEYAAYVEKNAKAEAAKLAKEHEMDKEIDDWLGLSVAVATGDDKTATTLSKRLSTKHKPKKGKVMAAADILSAAKARIKKKFSL